MTSASARLTVLPESGMNSTTVERGSAGICGATSSTAPEAPAASGTGNDFGFTEKIFGPEERFSTIAVRLPPK